MSNTRNYMAHGGDELVIGGKLTFLPGAVVEGAEGLFDLRVGFACVLLRCACTLRIRCAHPLTPFAMDAFRPR